MIETRRSIFKSSNINNLSVCIGWCADQVTVRSARCSDKHLENLYFLLAVMKCQSVNTACTLQSLIVHLWPTANLFHKADLENKYCPLDCYNSVNQWEHAVYLNSV